MSIRIAGELMQLAVAESERKYAILLQAVRTVASGMGNLSLKDMGDSGVNGINDGRARAIYLEVYVKTCRDALTDVAAIEAEGN